MSVSDNKPKRVRQPNKPKESRAFMVTQIDFEGNPIRQTMLFTNNVRNKTEYGGMVLTEKGYEDVIRKTGMEKAVIENYVNTRKRKVSKAPLLATICKDSCVVLDVDSFKKGRFYLTFSPTSDDIDDSDLTYVGTGLDLYWVVDDIKTMQENGLKQYIGVVS